MSKEGRQEFAEILEVLTHSEVGKHLNRAPDELFKLGAMASVCIYCLGFAIVTLNLQRFGVTYFDPFKAQYLLAGLWYLFPIFYSYLFLLIIFKLTSLSLRQPKPQHYKGLIAGWLVLATSFVTFAAILSKFIEFSNSTSKMELAYYAFSPFFLSCLFFYHRFNRLRTRIARLVPYLASSDRRQIIVGLILVLAVYGVVDFSRTAFPTIDKSVGGGHPIDVQLVFTDASMVRKLGLHVDSAQQFVPCQLLLETSDRVVVLADSSMKTALFIDKTQLLAITFKYR